MTQAQSILRSSNGRIALVAMVIVFLDQFTKHLIMGWLPLGHEKIIISGFFRFVHWGNTGAAWSIFSNSNKWLALIAAVALVVLYMSRHHFDYKTALGQVALGLIFGGIIGNLIDRVRHNHVVDFIYFYMQQRGGNEIGFPAFNIADTAICVGVGLIFIITWRNEHNAKAPEAVAGN